MEQRDKADLWHVVEVLIDLVITATSIELAPAVLPRPPSPVLPQVPVPRNRPVPVQRSPQPRRPVHLVVSRGLNNIEEEEYDSSWVKVKTK